MASKSFMSWRLAPSCASPIGTPAPSLRTERFALFLLYQSGSGLSSGRPTVPWSSPRQRRATTSRSRPPRRTPTAPAARSRGTPRPAPTPETAGAPSSTSTHRSRSTRFTASPSGAPAGSRPSRRGQAPASDECPTDETETAEATASARRTGVGDRVGVEQATEGKELRSRF